MTSVTCELSPTRRKRDGLVEFFRRWFAIIISYMYALEGTMSPTWCCSGKTFPGFFSQIVTFGSITSTTTHVYSFHLSWTSTSRTMSATDADGLSCLNHQMMLQGGESAGLTAAWQTCFWELLTEVSIQHISCRVSIRLALEQSAEESVSLGRLNSSSKSAGHSVSLSQTYSAAATYSAASDDTLAMLLSRLASGPVGFTVHRTFGHIDGTLL
mmetsp:Transcript_8028/g.19182  ORF Transcript_8028/g.19182 Transcript_8028/m.19182 type:complete len:213 (+) Transcript_8028:587-1225(+)